MGFFVFKLKTKLESILFRTKFISKDDSESNENEIIKTIW